MNKTLGISLDLNHEYLMMMYNAIGNDNFMDLSTDEKRDHLGEVLRINDFLKEVGGEYLDKDDIKIIEDLI